MVSEQISLLDNSTQDKPQNNKMAIRGENIIEARYTLTNKQNDVLDMLLLKLENDDKVDYELSVDEYKELLEENNTNVYRDLKRVVDLFKNKGLNFIDKDTNKETYFSWFSKIVYEPKQGKITIRLDKELKGLLCESKKRVPYDIRYTINFKSKHSQRIYYYLKSYEDTGFRIDVYEKLLHKMELPESYKKNFNNMQNRVLEVAKEEVNKNSDIKFNYKEIRVKNKVTHIQWFITKKEDAKYPTQTTIQQNECSKKYIRVIEHDIKNIVEDLIDESDIYKIANVLKSIEFSSYDEMLNYLKEKCNVALDYYNKNNKNIHFVALLIKSIKDNWNKNSNTLNNTNNNHPEQYNYKNKQFNNFKAREYDYDSLEKKLLGWDEE